ncbi:Scr1 family TA system antitoxin-like transcriptional regulator [Streptomyces nogalater]
MGESVDPGPVSGRAILGQTLKVLRDKAGKSLGQLAEDTGYDKSYLSRLESGERLSKVTVMEDLDSYYGTGSLLVGHWKAARLDAFKDQYKEFMKLEATARIMWKFSPGVPGLLQTEDFAREVLSGPQTMLEGTTGSRSRSRHASDGSTCCGRSQSPASASSWMSTRSGALRPFRRPGKSS